VIVTKSADMNTLVTPSMASSDPANESSVAIPAAKLFGASNWAPTENLRALGFGVGLGVTGIDLLVAALEIVA
jgi:hypothetical protein